MLISPGRIIRNLKQGYNNLSIYTIIIIMTINLYKIYTTHAFSNCPAAKMPVLK